MCWTFILFFPILSFLPFFHFSIFQVQLAFGYRMNSLFRRKELLTATCLKSKETTTFYVKFKTIDFLISLLFACTFLVFKLALDLFIVLTIIIMIMPFQNIQKKMPNRLAIIIIRLRTSHRTNKPEWRERKKKHSRKICAKTQPIWWRKKRT